MIRSLAAFLATIPTAALSALLDQCRAINHAIDCAVWGDDDDEDAVPTSYDEAYNEAVQHAADTEENLWGVAHFSAWETEYFMRGADQ